MKTCYVQLLILRNIAPGSRYFSTKLVKQIEGRYIMAPPNCFAIYRQFFDSQDFLLRSAFYALGNYIVAEIVKRSYYFKPVVVNRLYTLINYYPVSQYFQNCF